MLKSPAPRNFIIWQYIKINEDGSKQNCNLPPPTSVSRFVAIDARKRKHEETKELTDDDDGTQARTDMVFVEAASEDTNPGTPVITNVARVSALTPPKDTSESLAEKPTQGTHQYDEAGKALQFGDAYGNQSVDGSEST